MASALVNNVGPVGPPEGFLDLPPSAAYSSYGWLSPRISFSRDFSDEDKLQGSKDADEKPALAQPASKPPSSPSRAAAGEADLVVDFEFRRLDDPVTMLPADELFSDGKLVPLKLALIREAAAPDAAAPSSSSPSEPSASEIPPPETHKLRRKADIPGSDRFVAFSPKAPRCSSRWRELLGLKKAAQTGGGGGSKTEVQRPSSSSPVSSRIVTTTSKSAASRSLKHFLHRNTKSSSSTDASLSLPLLRDSDCDSVSISARLSLSSSSSSGPDHEDLPRLSLDSDKPSHISFSLARNLPRVRLTPKPRHHSTGSYHTPHHLTAAVTVGSSPAAAGGRVGRSRMRRPPGDSAAIPARGASVDSPRMNSSGKVVFQSLERSSSSPSTFNGGPGVKHRGMERSYSANVVRVTPVLNVPICSLRGSSKSGSVFGFGQLFSSSPHKKDGTTGAAAALAASSGAAARNNNGAVGRNWKAVTAERGI